MLQSTPGRLRAAKYEQKLVPYLNPMQFKVPQDVQREDTIIGPITLKQLTILGVGGGTAYGIYISLSKTYFMEVWLPPVVVISAITLAFAFLKIHGLQFHIFLMNYIEYHLLARKRIWIQGAGYAFMPPLENNKKKNDKSKPTKKIEEKQKSLEELTKVLDTHGGEYQIEQMEKKAGLEKIINQNYK